MVWIPNINYHVIKQSYLIYCLSNVQQNVVQTMASQCQSYWIKLHYQKRFFFKFVYWTFTAEFRTTECCHRRQYTDSEATQRCVFMGPAMCLHAIHRYVLMHPEVCLQATKSISSGTPEVCLKTTHNYVFMQPRGMSSGNPQVCLQAASSWRLRATHRYVFWQTWVANVFMQPRGNDFRRPKVWHLSATRRCLHTAQSYWRSHPVMLSSSYRGFDVVGYHHQELLLTCGKRVQV